MRACAALIHAVYRLSSIMRFEDRSSREEVVRVCKRIFAVMSGEELLIAADVESEKFRSTAGNKFFQ